jgi:hypothetical protein
MAGPGKILSDLRARLAARPDTEHEQGILRVIIVALWFLYLLPNSLAHHDPLPLYVISAFLGIALIIFFWIAYSRTISPFRRVFAQFVDVSSISTCMLLFGEPAAPLYLIGLAQLLPDLDFIYPPDEREVRSVEAGQVSRRIAELADSERLARGETSTDDTQQLLASVQPAMSVIDRAQLRRACVFVSGTRLDSLLPHAQAVRQVARLAQLEMFQYRQMGDFERMAQSLRRTLQLSRDLQHRGRNHRRAADRHGGWDRTAPLTPCGVSARRCQAGRSGTPGLRLRPGAGRSSDYLRPVGAEHCGSTMPLRRTSTMPLRRTSKRRFIPSRER